ncbi:MAG: RluA family pseudouridine synthase [Candidatus Eremiobacteraeota bacterium]|nr:RluA family pseudouridine synthase [Candidatus Eremiobacteraeota bacterium]
MNEVRDIVARGEDVGARLDVVVARHLARSRTASAELIRSGHVLLDGKAAKPASVVEAHQRIHIEAPPPRDVALAAQDLGITIIHDETDFCVVDKPSGMATHPARGTRDGTLVNALLARLGPLPAINGVRRPGIVHRLDKDTSGLLVVAKTDRGMAALTQMMTSRRIKRSYDAVVWGIPANPRGVIDAPLGRDPQARTKFAVREGGRRAVTHYRTAETYRHIAPEDRSAPTTAALLNVELETGRTHQIRVHSAAIGHPLIGDATYGVAYAGVQMRRQALHAASLAFAHPLTHKPLSYESPWPQDFAALVERLRAGGMP